MTNNMETAAKLLKKSSFLSDVLSTTAASTHYGAVHAESIRAAVGRTGAAALAAPSAAQGVKQQSGLKSKRRDLFLLKIESYVSSSQSNAVGSCAGRLAAALSSSRPVSAAVPLTSDSAGGNQRRDQSSDQIAGKQSARRRQQRFALFQRIRASDFLRTNKPTKQQSKRPTNKQTNEQTDLHLLIESVSVAFTGTLHLETTCSLLLVVRQFYTFSKNMCSPNQ